MEQNKYRVVVSERANQMLVSHAAFLAQVNLNAADRLVSAFEETANSLAYMPQRCALLSDEHIPRGAYRFIIFERRYMIIFQIKDDVVFVDFVVDCRQDYNWLLR
jgi:plasmid stabilization system protein ParE